MFKISYHVLPDPECSCDVNEYQAYKFNPKQMFLLHLLHRRGPRNHLFHHRLELRDKGWVSASAIERLPYGGVQD